MKFIVTLQNQMTGVTRDVEVESSYDATSVVTQEAKNRMNVPYVWDAITVRRTG